MKKITAFVLALAMVLGMAVGVFADTAKGSITVSNASKGETYTIYKLFDATVTADGKGIAYSGTIPATMTDYFEVKDGTIGLKSGKTMDETLQAALKTWTETATFTASKVGQGAAVVFDEIPYGYYVVTTTQGEQLITVDSTMPDAEIVDKNATVPVPDLYKTADKTDVKVGDEVTYTVSFTAANYEVVNKESKMIKQYVIADTLPTGVELIKVESITVAQKGKQAVDLTKQFENGKIVLDWATQAAADKPFSSLYDNGAKVTVTYTAKVNESVAIGPKGNTNTVEVTWNYTDGGQPEGTKRTTTASIYTYALAIQKVDENGNTLAGATFELPFTVKVTSDAGIYFYAGEGTQEVTTPENGVVIVKGVKSGDYTITETNAPNGFNKLAEPVTVSATVTEVTNEETTTYLDADGNITSTATDKKVVFKNNGLNVVPMVVVNKKGVELPATGGMGTTIFYVLGSVMLLGAAIMLVTKKRMNSEM